MRSPRFNRKLGNGGAVCQSVGVPDLDLLTLKNDGCGTSSDESLVVEEEQAPHPVAESSRLCSAHANVVPVSKWNLKFTGGEKEISLSAFLARVEELRIARHATKQDLLDGVIDLFSDRALV